MKNKKVSAAIIFAVVLFVVFVFGVYIGKQTGAGGSRESIIKEASIKKGGNSLQPSGETGSSQNNAATANQGNPISTGKVNFKPISGKLSSSNEVSSKSNTVTKNNTSSGVTENKGNTRVVYVKKPVYIYKYKYKYVPKKSFSGHAAPKSLAKSGKVYYTVQVAALLKYSEAKRFSKKLNSLGFFSYIVSVKEVRNGRMETLFKVRVGKFSTFSGAKSFEKLLASKMDVKPFITKVS